MESSEDTRELGQTKPTMLDSKPSDNRLLHLSSSATNARSFQSMLPPPSGTRKRKTLTERAGEPPRPSPAPPASRSTSGAVKPSIARLPQMTSSSLATSNGHRQTSNVSLNSAFTNIRPPSAQSCRTNSFLTKSIKPPSRPGSSFDTFPRTNSRVTHTENNSENPISYTYTACPLRKSLSSSTCRTTSGNSAQSSLSNAAANTASGTLRALPAGRSIRDMSLSTAFEGLHIESKALIMSSPSRRLQTHKVPSTPSHKPKKKSSMNFAASAGFDGVQFSPEKTSCSPRKRHRAPGAFLSKDSNIKATVWDPEARLEAVEAQYAEMAKMMSSTNAESTIQKETIALLKSRIDEHETIRTQLGTTNANLQRDLDAARVEATTRARELDDTIRKNNLDIDDMERKYRRQIDELKRDAEEDARRTDRLHADDISDLRKKLEGHIEDEQEKRRKEIDVLTCEGAQYQQRLQEEIKTKQQRVEYLQQELEKARTALSSERTLHIQLRDTLSEKETKIFGLEAGLKSARGHIEFLESDSKSQSQAFENLEQKSRDALREADEFRGKLRVEETLRRKLHNQIQELKGNIRVFCRIRPSLAADDAESKARMVLPDEAGDAKELEVMGPEETNSLGKVMTRKHAFSFDHVFAPTAQNTDVFDEISQLVQSALDGYNVCIFCYGQTGSGKTFTMSSTDGVIPRATRQIYETAKSLEEKGWTYSMEGSFVEVYNENINDLLGDANQFDKKKHEIKHDTARCKTTITDINTVELDAEDKVDIILQRASKNRSVAATKANERSSRSHSVFILRLAGENSVTGEKSEGTLNLVDLAGSERLSQSEATGARLKETQNINKSLSSLGDVIGALGQGKEGGGHIPYRNSKLTYLLQYSLGGNSKTLMFVMVSPLQTHLSETLTSLRFATKVHNTQIGTARRQTKA